jgi:GH25 family lysozyme M1 (1,4-beta-N-acetylmuramidase)
MQQPYQLLVDIWEGNVNLDALTLLSAGVTGMIVRLNNMQGGHHMDSRFEQDWELAKTFLVQTIYFVYNPWVDGAANAAWLLAHLPADFGARRILMDIEVTYPGYSPVTYRKEVIRFLGLVAQTNPTAIYTGGWFLDRLDSWPADVDYWWAAYAANLQDCKTWEEYREELGWDDFYTFTKKSPGLSMLWQCTGDGVLLPGFGGHAVDVNAFPGTLEDLQKWFNIGGQMASKWSTNARLKWVEQSTGAAPSLAGYDGAVIKLGDGHTMNSLASQQLQAVHDAGKPSIGFYTWRFDYTANMSFNQSAWPSAANDEYMKELTLAVMSGTVKRAYSGLIIDVSQTAQTSTAILSDQWVRDFAFKHLADMVYKAFGLPVWIYFTPAAYKSYSAHTGQNDLPFYMASIPDGKTAVGQTLALLNFGTVGTDGYPVDAYDPVKQKTTAGSEYLVLGCGYWGLVLYNGTTVDWLYNGTPAQMVSQLKFTAGSSPDPTPTPTPDPTPTPTTVDLSGVNAKLDQVLAGQAAIRALLERIFK